MSPIGTGEVTAPTVESSGGSMGIIIGVSIFFVLALILALVFMRRRRSPKHSQATKDVEIEIGTSKPFKHFNSPTQLLAQQMKVPNTWEPMKNKQKDTVQAAERFALRPGPERDHVCQEFMKTLKNSSIQVIDVQRIQNRSLWKQYATKRLDIISREGPSSQARYERVWLFHGTEEDTVEKIVQMGFDRNFAGKNMCKYGKGVYFARDASCKAAHRTMSI